MNKLSLSIDWEDFGQLFGKYHHGIVSDPNSGAIERQTEIILNLLDETDTKATFFILGMLAQCRPRLVQKISDRGHEIGVHGQMHEAMYSLSPDAARRDLEESVQRITAITGTAVYGYRAPYFSIDKSNLYVLEILSDLGFLYDSSIFPVRLPRYGIDDFNDTDTLYSLPNGNEIVELPLTVYTAFGNKWPVSGGGYIRLMPKWLIRKIYMDFYKEEIDGMIYMHPYEFDNRPIDVSTNYPEGVSRSTFQVYAQNFRWNLFRSSILSKIRYLLSEYQFTTCLERAMNVKNHGNRTDVLGCS